MSYLKTEISSVEIKSFAKQLSGKIVLPIDEGYDETRKVYNAMIDKHPAIFVMCQDVPDVILAVNFARENNMLAAIRGGGHNGGGLGLCDDGMVIDLSGIKFVVVNTFNNTVKVGGGNIWR